MTTEDPLPQTREIVGDHILVYASDGPHGDHEYRQSSEPLGEREDLIEG
jgi:hypothetical protein